MVLLLTDSLELSVWSIGDLPLSEFDDEGGPLITFLYFVSLVPDFLLLF